MHFRTYLNSHPLHLLSCHRDVTYKQHLRADSLDQRSSNLHTYWNYFEDCQNTMCFPSRVSGLGQMCAVAALLAQGWMSLKVLTLPQPLRHGLRSSHYLECSHLSITYSSWLSLQTSSGCHTPYALCLRKEGSYWPVNLWVGTTPET